MQRAGARFHGRHLVIVHAANALDGPRFGLAVSRKVGSAVVRNRVKRWIREAVRQGRREVGAFDVVFIARASAATAGYPGVRDEVSRALATLRGAV